jgi:hypothetical protein
MTLATARPMEQESLVRIFSDKPSDQNEPVGITGASIKPSSSPHERLGAALAAHKGLV